MYVKTNYDVCSYITKGKVYEVFDNENYLDFVNADDGEPSFIHAIDGGLFSLNLEGVSAAWIICDKNGDEL